MMRAGKFVLIVGLVVLAAGCQRLSGGRNYAEPLPATPTTPVARDSLHRLIQRAGRRSQRSVGSADRPGQQPGCSACRCQGSWPDRPSGWLENHLRWRQLHGLHDADNMVRRLPCKYQRLCFACTVRDLCMGPERQSGGPEGRHRPDRCAALLQRFRPVQRSDLYRIADLAVPLRPLRIYAGQLAL